MIFLLFAAILPFIVWPIEQFFPFPYAIEEIAKAILVYFIIRNVDKEAQIKTTILSGSSFAISESIFYLFNILVIGTSITFVQRLLLTIPLHVTTLLIILYFGRKRIELIPIGLVIAAMIHFYFNVLIGRL